jgi:predicted amidophosphoribosyltransferase
VRENDNEETEAALDALEKATLPATLAQRERCPTCGGWLDDHGGKWCACPACGKPFEPAHGCKAADYVWIDDDPINGKIPF